MIPNDVSALGRSTLSRCGYLVLRGCLGGEAVRNLQTLSHEMSAAAAGILAEAQRSGETAAAHAASRVSELIVVPEASDTGRVCRYEFMYERQPTVPGVRRRDADSTGIGGDR